MSLARFLSSSLRVLVLVVAILGFLGRQPQTEAVDASRAESKFT